MDNAIASLLGTLFGAALGIFLGAILVQHATKWLAGFKPAYGVTCLAVFFAYLASLAIGLFIGFAVAVNEAEVTGVVSVCILVASFFAQAGFYSFMIRRPDGVILGFGKACLVSLIQVVVAVLAVAGIALMLAGAMSLSR